ncbi:YhfT family protein, partial [Escherichia coli]
MPVDFMSNLSRVGDPVVVCFSLFPALAVGYQYGYKKGVWVLVATLAGYWVAQSFGSITFGGRIEKPVNLDPNGVALLRAMIAMF